MSDTHHVSFVRDDGTSVDVAASVQCEGYPLPWYVVDHVATLPDSDTVVVLTDAEIERLDEQVAENPPTY